MVLLSDDELIDMFLSFGFMAFQSGHHALRYGAGPGLWLLSLDPEERVGVQVTQRDGETVRKLLGRQQLRVKKIFSVVLHILALLGRFTALRSGEVELAGLCLVVPLERRHAVGVLRNPGGRHVTRLKTDSAASLGQTLRVPLERRHAVG